MQQPKQCLINLGKPNVRPNRLVTHKNNYKDEQKSILTKNTKINNSPKIKKKRMRWIYQEMKIVIMM